MIVFRGFFLIAALFSAPSALAIVEPITKDVVFKNKLLAQRLFETLERTYTPVAVGSKFEISVDGYLTCSKQRVGSKYGFSCQLKPGVWSVNGMEGSYIVKDPAVVNKIFDVLLPPHVVEEEMVFRSSGVTIYSRTLSWDRKRRPGDSGADSSQLSCTVTSSGGERFETPKCILFNEL